MLDLPVSGVPLRFCAVTGVHERQLWAARGDTGPAAVARLLDALCESEAVDEWLALPVSDADAALLAGRRQWVGDRIATTVRCPFADCGEMAAVDFSIGEYLDYRRPTLPRGVERCDEAYRFDGIRFRAPTLADEDAARASATPVRTLSRRCIDAAAPGAVRRIERLLEKVAPSLVSELGLTCPGCGRAHTATFDPRAFVLKELADQAQFLWDDVHLIAAQYHWPLDEILALDRATRLQLAERVRGDRLAGA